MKKLILVMNDHAEVGKTCFSSALVRSLRDQEVKVSFLSVIGEDEDDSSQGPVSCDGIWNIIAENNIDVLYGWMDECDALVCDVQTGYADAIMELYESEDLDLELGERNIELTVATPQVDEAVCNEEITAIAERIADNAYYVVPRIPVDEFGTYLEAWEDSEASTKLEYLGAVVLEVPRITDSMQETLEGHEITLLEAVSPSETESPSEVESMMASWRRDFDYQLEEALDYFLPQVRRPALRHSASA